MQYRELRGDIFLRDEQCKGNVEEITSWTQAVLDPSRVLVWGCYSKKFEFESINTSADVFQTF